VTVGSGVLRYEAVPGWPQVPEDARLVEAVALALNSRDEIFVFARADVPVLVFNRDGDFLRGWERVDFERPHGIWIAPDDSVYLVDDFGHRVTHHSPDGELIRTIGPSGVPAQTGVVGLDYRTIRPGGGPFNMPTDLVTLSNGDIVITDGYGNARVHRFSREGELLCSWGEPGSGAGQFCVPHGIGVDENDNVYVCDRENSRIQVFSQAGNLLDVWTDVARPTEAFVARDGLVYVSELGFRAGVFPWNTRDVGKTGGRVSVFDPEGNLQARFGGGDDPSSSEDFFSPHDVQVDSDGSIYVAEVKVSAANHPDDDTSRFPTLRKFARAGASSSDGPPRVRHG